MVFPRDSPIVRDLSGCRDQIGRQQGATDLRLWGSACPTASLHSRWRTGRPRAIATGPLRAILLAANTHQTDGTSAADTRFIVMYLVLVRLTDRRCHPRAPDYLGEHGVARPSGSRNVTAAKVSSIRTPQSRPQATHVEGGPSGTMANRTRPSSVSDRRSSVSLGRANPYFCLMARKRGSSAATSSRISTVADNKTARKPMGSSMAISARESRRKMAYLARLRVVET